MELHEKIPNNVNLSSDPKLKRALENWQPNYVDWWMEMGPEGFQNDDVYLRTAISVDPGGWAHYDYVKMPDYRWGLFLTPPEEDRKIGFGDHEGEPVWQEVPGELRTQLRRLIVTQGDTEPASVEQQRLLGKTAPSLYDLRNLFQVNVEEGRHLRDGIITLVILSQFLQKHFSLKTFNNLTGFEHKSSSMRKFHNFLWILPDRIFKEYRISWILLSSRRTPACRSFSIVSRFSGWRKCSAMLEAIFGPMPGTAINSSSDAPPSRSSEPKWRASSSPVSEPR